MQEEMDQTEVPMGAGLSLIVKAEIDMQIATAKAYRRSLKTFKTDATSMACLDEETAASCLYSLPRGGKSIDGGSIRFAEIIAAAWGNLRMGARVVSADARVLTAQGLCHDLESNNAITMETQRRITNKKGERFNDDMIVVTGNAAASVALRNAILRVVPKAYWQPVLLEARKVAIGDARTLASRRQQAIEYFAKMGVVVDRVLGVLERKSIEDVDLDDLATLQGIKTAIKEGTITIEAAFPEPAPDAKPSSNGTEPAPDAKPSSNGTEPAGTLADRIRKSRPPKKEAEARASAEQLASIDDLVRNLGVSPEGVQWLLKEAGVTAFAKLTPEGAADVIRRLEAEWQDAQNQTVETT